MVIPICTLDWCVDMSKADHFPTRHKHGILFQTSACAPTPQLCAQNTRAVAESRQLDPFNGARMSECFSLTEHLELIVRTGIRLPRM